VRNYRGMKGTPEATTSNAEIPIYGTLTGSSPVAGTTLQNP